MSPSVKRKPAHWYVITQKTEASQYSPVLLLSETGGQVCVDAGIPHKRVEEIDLVLFAAIHDARCVRPVRGTKFHPRQVLRYRAGRWRHAGQRDGDWTSVVLFMRQSSKEESKRL